MTSKRENSFNVQSIERALLLLETLSQHPSGCSIKFLAELTQLNKSTIHRILHTLLNYGYVRQNPKNGYYHLGLKLLAMSNHLLEEFDIVSIAKPQLKRACDETGLVTQLSIRDKNNAVFLDKVEHTDQNVRMYSRVGKSIPLYCSSSGKVLLAWEEPEEISRTVSSLEYQSFTPFTITNAACFTKEIIDIQNKGYATDFFEHENSVCCVASPIIDSLGKVVAAVCFAGTFLQISSSRLSDYIKKIHDTAQQISYLIGCSFYPAKLDSEKIAADTVLYNERVQAIIQQFQ